MQKKSETVNCRFEKSQVKNFYLSSDDIVYQNGEKFLEMLASLEKTNELKLFLLFLSKIDPNDYALHNGKMESQFSKTLWISADEYQSACKIPKKDYRWGTLVKILKDLSNRKLVLQGKKRETSINWIRAITTINEGEQRFVGAELDPTFAQIFLRLHGSSWSSYFLREVASLQSNKTVLFYLALVQFQKNGMLVQSVDYLKKLFNLEEVSSYRRMSEFRKFLKQRIEQINDSETPFYVAQMEEITEGKEVKRIKFSIEPRPTDRR